MIEKYPSKVLLTVSTECSLEEGQKVAELLQEEAKLLTWGKVVGLAAPQIGINKRVFMALGHIYINPEITYSWPHKIKYQEGCYSLKEDKFDYPVERAFRIKLKWTALNGRQKEKEFSGFDAQVIQHEYDHLEGRLCCN